MFRLVKYAHVRGIREYNIMPYVLLGTPGLPPTQFFAHLLEERAKNEKEKEEEKKTP